MQWSQRESGGKGCLLQINNGQKVVIYIPMNESFEWVMQT